MPGEPGPHCGVPGPRSGPGAARRSQLRHTNTSRPRTMERPPLASRASGEPAPPGPAPRGPSVPSLPVCPGPAWPGRPRPARGAARPRSGPRSRRRPRGAARRQRPSRPAPTEPCPPWPVLTATSRAPPRPGTKSSRSPGALLWRLDAPRWRLPPSSRAPSPSRRAAPPGSTRSTYLRTYVRRAPRVTSHPACGAHVTALVGGLATPPGPSHLALSF